MREGECHARRLCPGARRAYLSGRQRGECHVPPRPAKTTSAAGGVRAKVTPYARRPSAPDSSARGWHRLLTLMLKIDRRGHSAVYPSSRHANVILPAAVGAGEGVGRRGRVPRCCPLHLRSHHHRASQQRHARTRQLTSSSRQETLGRTGRRFNLVNC